MDNILSAENILGVIDYEIHKLHVSEWGGVVCLRPFSARLKDRIEQIMTQSKNTDSLRGISLVGSICDEKGKLLFRHTDSQKLSEKDGNAVDKIMKKIFEINNFDQSGIDDQVKN